MKTRKIIFPLIFAVYLACFIWVGNYGAFWSEDAGIKYLQAINLTRSDWTDSSFKYPGIEIDPGLKFNPLFGNHTLIKNNRIYSIYPSPFAFLSSLLYKMLGFPGLYLLPLFSTFLLLIFVYKLASQLWKPQLEGSIIGAGSPSHRQLLGYQYYKTSPQDQNSVYAITLITAFCTPLFFYAFTFWEINIAALFSISGLYIFLKGKALTSQRTMIFSGIILGAGIFFREESVLFLLSLIIVQFAFRRNRRNGVLLALGALIPLLGFIALEYLTRGVSMAHLLHNISTRSHHFSSLSNFLAYKWDLIYQLLFSGNQKMIINLILIFPSILFIFITLIRIWPKSTSNRVLMSLRGRHDRSNLLKDRGLLRRSFITPRNYNSDLGVFGQTLINNNKQGNGKDFISLILLSAVLASYLCYFALLLTSKYPIRLTPFTNGLLIFSPWILFGFQLPDKKRKNTSAELLWLAGIFILLVCLTVPTSGGLQWGPRYLVLIYPVLVIISYSSFVHWKEKIRFKKWLTFIFVSLILLGIINEIYGLHLLKVKKRFNRNLIEKLSKSEARTIVSLPWWIPLNTTPIFYDKVFFSARGPRELSRLLELLRANRQEAFLLVTENDSSIVDFISAHFHILPQRIEEVRLPGDDYFQVNLLEYTID